MNKPKNSNLSKSLGRTLVESDLTKVTGNVLETILEKEIIDNEIIRSIPIINTLYGVGKTYRSIQDFLFTQKLISFLLELSTIDSRQRKNMIEKIESNPKFNQKIGNKLLNIIDNSQDYQSSKYIGMLFAAFIEGELDYQEFCKASLIINRIEYFDLQEFLEIPDKAYGQNGTEGLGLEENDNFFVIAGLCSIETETPFAEKTQGNNYEETYEILGGKTIIYRTLIGSKIFKILNDKTVTNKELS